MNSEDLLLHTGDLEEPVKDPRWPGEPGHIPEDVKQRINELLFYALPPDVRIGDMDPMAAQMHERIQAEWDRYVQSLKAVE